MNNNLTEQFNSKGYCIVPKVLDKTTTDLICQYALNQRLQNFTPELEGELVPGSHAKYADPMMEALLVYLHPTVENIVGIPITPTYSYYRIYSPGANLSAHTDRESCEYSVTLSLGHDFKELNGSFTYPIKLDWDEILLEPGDIAIYKGIELTHSRKAFDVPEGSYQVQVFLHYVKTETINTNSSLLYDSRPYVGIKHKYYINKSLIANVDSFIWYKNNPYKE
jgi:hypothetical protein